MNAPRVFAYFAVPLSLVSIPGLAYAGEEARADALYQEGQGLMKQGRYADACARFAESQRISPSGGATLNLGECSDKLGRPVEAWNYFSAAAKTAHAAGKPDIESYARGKASALDAKVTIVTIDAAIAPGVAETISLDGGAVQTSEWTEPHAVFPGDHKLAAHAASHTPFELVVHLAAGETRALHVPQLAPGLDTATPQAGGDASSTSSQLIAGISVAAIGGASLIAGGALGGVALGKNSDAAKLCPGNRCTQEGWSLTQQALTLAHASTSLLAIGGAAAGVGIIVIATAPRSHGGARPVAITPWVGYGNAGVSGAF